MSRRTTSLRDRLSLRQLRLVLGLAETKSVNRAADLVGLSQPAATRSLAELEKSLGVRLFRRSPTGVVPTASGEALIHHARRIVDVVNTARNEISALSTGASGVLRVGTIVAGAVELVPRAIIEVSRLFPGLRIQVLQQAQDELLESLRQGDIDLAIARRVSAAEEPALDAWELVQESYCVVCDVDSRWARRRRVSLADLLDEAWIFPAVAGPLNTRLERRFIDSVGRLPAHIVDSLSLQTSLSLVRDGGYLCVMPRHLAEHYARLDRVRILPLEAWFVLGPITLYMRHEEPAAPAALALADALRRAARDVRR